MLERNHHLGLMILRLFVGGLMLFHGIAKVEHGIDFIKEAAGPLAYGVYFGELLAPLAIVLGYRTRLAALVFAINCIAAIVIAHSTEVLRLNEYGGYALELLMLYIVGAITLFFTGGGVFAVSVNSKWD
ncbi:MAG: hypothetical protein RLZZ500_2130 [Bacteroidota bacterium]|jgi:putative oxidoreductase